MFKIPFTKIRFGPKRDHWTHLQVKIDKDGKVTAQHTDSQSRLKHAIYNLDPIKDAVKSVFPNANFTSKATGTQKDGVNCGRYAMAHEVASLKGEAPPKDPLKYANETLHVNERCNNFEEKSKDLDGLAVKTCEQIREEQRVEEQRIDQNIKLAAQNKRAQQDIQGTQPRSMTAVKIETAAEAKYGTPEPKEKTSRVKFADKSTTVEHEVDAPTNKRTGQQKTDLTPTGNHGKERSEHPEDRAVVTRLVQTVQKHSYSPGNPPPTRSALRSAPKMQEDKKAQDAGRL